MSPLYKVFAAVPYQGMPKTLIHELKFTHARAAAVDVARMMADTLPKDADWVITYVPTAPTRVRARGYDQAAAIARELSRLLGVPCLPLLARVSSHRQVGQGRAVRQQQMQHAFRVVRSSALHNKHVLLVDDVLTTGATCEAAATLLKAAGAKRVSAAVFAAA